MGNAAREGTPVPEGSTAEVRVREGRLLGRAERGVFAFKGIPYAAPPFGARRMRPPAPAPAWDGVREAFAYGPTVPKGPYPPPYDALLPEPDIPGEDCLNCNVWTPDPAAAGLPVLVWIHGGAFANGSGAVPTYAGHRFAEDGVVCVTINYRLGADGFLYAGDEIANVGLADQLAALRWVADNIAAFGGDPAKVTIAGESAGAMSVATLLASPLSAGLFRGAIPQSGAGHHVLSPETALRVAGRLAERLGVAPTRAAMAAVPLPALLDAQQALAAEAAATPDPGRWGEIATNQMIWEPVVAAPIVPEVPHRAVAQGAGREIALLVGTNTDEQRLFLVPNGLVDLVDETLLGLLASAYGLDEAGLARYRENRPDATPGELVVAFGTDWFFRIPAIRLAEARSGGPAGTWMYEFAWPSPAFGGRLGACHALELPFVFDTLETERDELLGAERPEVLARLVHDAWVRFVSDLDPGWAPYDLDTRAVMTFGPDMEAHEVTDPRGDERACWEGRR